MTKIILDAELRSRLGDLAGPIELCDEAGRTLGHCLPAELSRHLMAGWLHEQADALVSDEELDRRSRGPRGRKFAEFRYRLGRS